MSALVNQASLSLRLLQTTFSRLSIGPAALLGQQFTRERITVTNPRLRNPVWFVRKNRTIHDDLITSENQGFIKEVVHDKYGVPSIIKGVPTYKNSVTQKPVENVANQEWTPLTRRVGAIARKIGQYPLWKKDGTKIRTTLLQISDNHVIKYTPPGEFKPTLKPKHRKLERFGCALVGAESTDPSLLTKEYCGLFSSSGVMPKKIIGRFIISPEAAPLPGTPISVSHFRVGDYVDVRGKTVDRGFQGVCKRHGFKGMPASHGHTKTHRRGGNIGAGGNKARVFPGTKMPGHMGNRYRVARGLKIWRINTKYNVMWVTGSAIPGETNHPVYVFDTMLPTRKPKTPPALPTVSEEANAGIVGQAENIWDEELHDFEDATITFEPEA